VSAIFIGECSPLATHSGMTCSCVCEMGEMSALHNVFAF